ncbi:MAG: hypothetical protein QM800_13495 [Paludibacter sp.]
MKDIEYIHKLSVLHCVYQLIASADGQIDEERDEAAIDLALSELGFNSVYMWDSALKLNPHDCFWHVSTLNDAEKQLVKNLFLKIVEMGGNTNLRRTCANHLFQFCFI